MEKQSPMGKENDVKLESYRFFPSVRLLSCSLVFLGTLSTICNFASFNFTIVCMVNSTALADENSGKRPVKTISGQCSAAILAQNTSDTTHFDRDSALGYQGDIVWTREQQSNLLAAFSISMALLTFPAGIIVQKFGPKRICICGQLLAAVASYLIPTLAYHNIWLVWVARVLTGGAGAIIFPSILYTTTRWVPANEVGRMMTICMSGFPLGTVLAYLISGSFCSLDSHGWMWALYFIASINTAFVFLFWFLFSDDPSLNRFISETELHYILSTRSLKSRKSTASPSLREIPWLKIFTSGAVLATMTSGFAMSFAFYFITIYIPVYMKEILLFDSASNGIMSALPNLVQFLGRLLFGWLSDILSARIGRTTSVKLFDVLSIGSPGVAFLVLSFLDCNTWQAAVTCFCIGLFFYAANTGGALKSLHYIAPRYVGVISALSGCMMSLPAVLVPYIVGALIPDGMVQQWQHVFYTGVGVSCFGIVFSILFLSGEEQSWANANKRTPTASANSTCNSPQTNEAVYCLEQRQHSGKNATEEYAKTEIVAA